MFWRRFAARTAYWWFWRAVSCLLLAMSGRSEKITFAEMRASGVRGPLVYCSD